MGISVSEEAMQVVVALGSLGNWSACFPTYLGAGVAPSSGPWVSLHWEGSAPGGCGLLARMLGSQGDTKSPAVSEGSFE